MTDWQKKLHIRVALFVYDLREKMIYKKKLSTFANQNQVQ